MWIYIAPRFDNSNAPSNKNLQYRKIGLYCIIYFKLCNLMPCYKLFSFCTLYCSVLDVGPLENQPLLKGDPP